MLRIFYTSGLAHKDMNKAALLAVAIMMAGCASTNSTEPNRHNWVKNGASHDEIMRDLNSCREQERQRSVREGYNTSKTRDVALVVERIHICMEEKGYREK